MSEPDIETSELLSSRIHVGNGALREVRGWLDEYTLSKKQLFLLTDENTHRHCLPLLQPLLPVACPEYILPSGEKAKSLEQAEKIWNWLLRQGAGRDDLLLALGGGVVTDLGGFVASAYKRGMDSLNIPTSLIGQVDAAVGGKTSVNLNHSKNQVGSFHFPVAVIIDPVFLKTLPVEHLRSGYAEMLKGALLASEQSWSQARELDYRNVDSLGPAIRESVRFKSEVVRSDPYDRHLRRVLNFGHTLGHALEACAAMKHPPGMLHGDAVAWGMAGELCMAWQMGIVSEEEMKPINDFLLRTFPPPPVTPPDKKALWEAIQMDKKNASGRIRISTLEGIGNPVINLECGAEMINRAIDHLIKQSGYEQDIERRQ